MESRSSFTRISSESFFQSRLMYNITCVALPLLGLKCSCEVSFFCTTCVFGFLAFWIVVLFSYRSSRSFARSNIITYTICRKCLGLYYVSCDYGTFTWPSEGVWGHSRMFFLFNGLIGKIRSERMSCNVTVVLCCFWVRNVYSSWVLFVLLVCLACWRS